MRFFFNIINLIRPLNIAIAIFASFVVFQFHSFGSATTFFQLCVVLICYMSAGNILNDYIDIDTDKINKPNRTFVRYNINGTFVKFIIALLFIMGTIFATFQNYLAQCIAIYIAMPLIILYELILKKIPLIGNIVISLLVGLVFIFIEVGITDNVVYTWKIMLLAFTLNLIREIIKDIQDIQGDQNLHYNTLPIIFGVKTTIILLRIIAILFFILSISPIYYSYHLIYFPLIFFLIHLPLLYIMWRLNNNIIASECHFFSLILKVMIFLGVFIILLSQ